jgi:hypothetical protein
VLVQEAMRLNSGTAAGKSTDNPTDNKSLSQAERRRLGFERAMGRGSEMMRIVRDSGRWLFVDCALKRRVLLIGAINRLC